ncbi:hypothetical protein ACFVKB_42825 [Rhodococcus sp. NPDC127530]|uniref:hypothetical protein n=1 Tax=unclassified Rhodococcus (in: high G+C Gram-positive bacteria) TaxID=192944 RepID=UPI003632D534
MELDFGFERGLHRRQRMGEVLLEQSERFGRPVTDASVVVERRLQYAAGYHHVVDRAEPQSIWGVEPLTEHHGLP